MAESREIDRAMATTLRFHLAYAPRPGLHLLGRRSARLRPARPFRLGQPFEFFVAFLVGKPHGGKLVVTARDASGEVLARRSFDVLDSAIPQAQACEMAHRILREGLE